MIAGLARGSGDLMRMWPREAGRRLHTLAVNAGNGCRGSPNFSSDSGCTWNSRLGVACAGSLFTSAPRWEGAMVRGPVRYSAYSSAIFALPHQELGLENALYRT